MRPKLPVYTRRSFILILLAIAFGTILSGCGGSGDSEARSSSWMGLPSETLEGVGASVRVVAPSGILGAGRSMPIVVFLKDRYGHAVADETPLTVGSKLGSSIEPGVSGGSLSAKNGSVQCIVTAAAITGVETLTFVSPQAVGSVSFQITFEAQPSPVVRVAPVADTVKVSGTLPVVVFVSNGSGIPLDSEVRMFCLNGGSFKDESGSASGGVFLTEFTAPADQGVCWISAIVNGKTASTSVAVLP